MRFYTVKDENGESTIVEAESHREAASKATKTWGGYNGACDSVADDPANCWVEDGDGKTVHFHLETDESGDVVGLLN